MAAAQTAFVWYELMTTDLDGAAAFYGAVIGWSIANGDPAQSGGMDYRMIVRSDGGITGGAMQLTDAMVANGALPRWTPYLRTSDVDATVAAIEREGGRTMMPAYDLQVGRIAMVADPQGIVIYVMKPVAPAGQPGALSPVFSTTDPQHVRWNELVTPDQQRSMDFYARHFGFGYPDRMAMGVMGDYWFINQGETRIGAMMRQSNAMQPTMWTFYFGVPSAEAARAAIDANGGLVLMGPMEVPGGEWIVLATDPQGAIFGCVGPRTG